MREEMGTTTKKDSYKMVDVWGIVGSLMTSQWRVVIAREKECERSQKGSSSLLPLIPEP